MLNARLFPFFTHWLDVVKMVLLSGPVVVFLLVFASGLVDRFLLSLNFNISLHTRLFSIRCVFFV